ncbi:FAD binding domain-containing protein [Dyadobacter psychrotolerans]|uniref:Xanthine dehydrogenase family protein subunit M n=1 Tax=Dyadobacter psychrotolerans TaxID=2541721 RepID=A0A4R5DUQ9_9BACT|nr:xanthine dehydrogenase family protein subunit M [Dyadobacter psychrotolerans]TDE14703.1 xanthine dehydrogenase family protein subunit M [Dyadobacter psychrotolerans]
MNNFSYIKANDLPTAFGHVRLGDAAKYIAGGTNLIDLMKYNLTKASSLVDINHLVGNHDIEELPDGGLRLGAFVRNAATAYHPLVEERYPLLSRAILAGASAQIRNMATNGGNLLQRTRCYYFYDANTPCNKREPGSGCSAILGYNRIMAILGTSESCIAVFPSDMCVALAALDAVVNISGEDGERSLAFADFHRLPGDTPELDNNLKPGEIITSIDIPQKGFARNYSYLKLRDRNSYAFALVSVATGLELENGLIKDARIALGGVAHKPWRVKEAEDFLKEKEPSAENFAQAAEIILFGAKVFEYNSFKVELAKRAIVRNCMMALNPESQLPGAQPSA